MVMPSLVQTNVFGLFLQAAEKGNHVIEADEKGYCMLMPRIAKELDDERPLMHEEKSEKSSLKQKKQGKTQQRCLETEWQNARNCEKTVKNSTITNGGLSAYLDGKHMVGKSDFAKQEHGPENTGQVEKRKKKKEKQCAANEVSRASEERCVIVNGNGQEAVRYVEHTRGARLPVREEAEPRHCGEECPPKETQGDSQGKKAKGRKKKKTGSLGKNFVYDVYDAFIISCRLK